jgi:hypothetical protein
MRYAAVLLGLAIVLASIATVRADIVSNGEDASKPE